MCVCAEAVNRRRMDEWGERSCYRGGSATRFQMKVVLLTSEMRGRSQVKKDKRALRTVASCTVHQAKAEAIAGLFTSPPISRAHAPKSDAKDDWTKSE